MQYVTIVGTASVLVMTLTAHIHRISYLWCWSGWSAFISPICHASCHFVSLPLVSLSLARAGKILSPPGGLGPLDIVAELAALDGLKDHAKSVRALEQVKRRHTDRRKSRALASYIFRVKRCLGLERSVWFEASLLTDGGGAGHTKG